MKLTLKMVCLLSSLVSFSALAQSFDAVTVDKATRTQRMDRVLFNNPNNEFVGIRLVINDGSSPTNGNVYAIVGAVLWDFDIILALWETALPDFLVPFNRGSGVIGLWEVSGGILIPIVATGTDTLWEVDGSDYLIPKV